MPDIHLQLANDSDKWLNTAYEIFCSHRERPWSFDLFCKTIRNHNAMYAFDGQTLVAYAIFSQCDQEAELEDICVAEAYRHRGIAKQVLSAVIRHCRNQKMAYLLLEVDEQNSAAMRLYRGLGFENVGVRKSYYTHKDGTCTNAIIMRLFC